MSDSSSTALNSDTKSENTLECEESNNQTPSTAFASALERARLVASKIQSPSSVDNPASSPSLPSSLDPLGSTSSALKRPLGSSDPYLSQPSKRANMDGAVGVSGSELPTTEVIMVPDKMVGLIIGRGGEQITRMQNETGVKIQMAPDSAGSSERQCSLTGLPSNIAMAKASIERIIANEGNQGMNKFGAGGAPGASAVGAPGGGLFEMMVPGHKVGLIIGKSGEQIKSMQEQSGAKIVIIQDTPEAAPEKPLRITGPPEAVEVAKQLVQDILNASDERDMGFGGRGRGGVGGRGMGGPGAFRPGMARGGGQFMAGGRGAPMGRGGGIRGFGAGQWGSEYGGQTIEYVPVPSNKCGLIIGKGGETIKNINLTTGAQCEIDKQAPAEAREKNFIVRGSAEAVARAKEMILEKLGVPGQGGYGGGGGGGYGGGQWGQGGYPGYDSGAPSGVAVNPQTGQPDYSAQWAEYYRSMGMTAEAEQIERSRAATGPGGNAPAAAPANGASANGSDYSAQWAEYYRSIGKIKEAESIEAQMKQKAATAAGGPPGGATGQAYPAQYTGYYGNYVSQ